MKKLLIIALLSFISIMSAEEMTAEKFKKIMTGKESKTVRKELQFMPILKKYSQTIKFSYPDKEGFTAKATGEEKYIEGKYIFTVMNLPDDVKFYSLVLWNEKEKVVEGWFLTPDNKISKVIGKPAKVKGRYNWTGKTSDGGKYKGYADYSPGLVSWEGKYYSKEGKVLYSESGNAVPIK